jgi:hypothetical protein
MSKKKYITQRPTKQSNTIAYLVQARITATRELHVCQNCGNDAHFLDTGYEAFTQELANELHAEMRQHSTFAAQWQAAASSPVSQKVYRGTLLEQQNRGPREHISQYRCLSCMAMMLDAATFMPGSGAPVLLELLASPTSHALFLVRLLNQSGRLAVMHAPYQDVDAMLQFLQQQGMGGSHECQ